jgi:hypothetical protein
MAPCVLYLHSSNNIHQVSGLTSNDPVDLNATMNVNYIIDSWGARAAVFLLKRLDPCRSRLQSCLPWDLGDGSGGATMLQNGGVDIPGNTDLLKACGK